MSLFYEFFILSIKEPLSVISSYVGLVSSKRFVSNNLLVIFEPAFSEYYKLGFTLTTGLMHFLLFYGFKTSSRDFGQRT
jgi:hypothetical protein